MGQINEVVAVEERRTEYHQAAVRAGAGPALAGSDVAPWCVTNLADYNAIRASNHGG